MPLDHYVTLGRSGLRVSPLCLGAMTFGEDLGWGSSVEESNAIIDDYLERGGNFIDTANVYTHGHSEKIIGDLVGKDRARRDRVVLATKFFGGMFPGDPNSGGANRKAIITSLENSLRRLQTDYIDLYWMHTWDETTPIEETMRTLEDLVASGKVRYLGFSDTPAWKCAEAQTLARLRGWAPLVALQIEYSLLERTVEGELVPMARELGLGITPWSPLKSGVLSGKYTRANHGQQKAARGAWAEGSLTDKTYDIVDALIATAKEVDSTPARVALAWLAQKPGVTSIILGARSTKQLDDNLAAADLVLSPAQVQKLDELSKPSLNFPADFMGMIPSFGYAGTNINGRSAPISPFVPQKNGVRY
ncbi:MAG TPA: aldo/keto reductase [Polyangiaceae bacterium]|nr:aldo/keto reductase [Polyangiaceae bacterium]